MDAFIQSEYEKAKFLDIDVYQEVITGIVFNHCQFTSCKFLECTFRNCKFINCTFLKCDLSVMKHEDTSFEEVIFKQSKLIGVEWIAPEKSTLIIVKIHFEECMLNYSYFYEIELKGMHMKYCEAHEIEFTKVNASDADFEGTDFKDSQFNSNNFSKANFLKAYNYYLDPTHNIVRGAKFAFPDVLGLLMPFKIKVEGYNEE